ncbi:MAG: hypothetical protein NZ553_06490 [Caldilinea sp.]|nr:hypothetical protein [Caldilinea sp.]MDW8440099.1 hypothetical protein [Caldilineaceae bacterium]
MSCKRWLLLAAPPSILYLMLAALYFLAIPLGESPDEPGHLQCIQQVALYDRLPIVDPKPQGEWWKPGVTLSGRMCYHMPLYYVGAGLLQKAISAVTGEPPAVDFPEHNEAFGETGVMFLHPNKQRLLQSEEPAVVFGVRVASVLLGLAVVWATLATAHLLFPQFPTIVLVAGVWIAGWPQFLFLSRAINNDVLATALASITLAMLLRVGKPNRYPALAALSALAVLTKVTMLFVVGAVAAVWTLEFVRFSLQRRALVRSAVAMLIVWSATATLVHLTPTIRANFWSSARTFSAIREQVFQIEYWLEVGRLTLSSGWVRFGWMNVAAPDATAYLWWSIVFGLMLIGSVCWWRAAPPERNLLAMVLLIWFLGVMASYVRINTAVFQPQFRFLQSLLPILSALVAGGLLCRTPQRLRPQIILSGALIVVAVIINVAIIWGIVMPRYGLSI